MVLKRLPPHPATLGVPRAPHRVQHLSTCEQQARTVQRMEAPPAVWYVNLLKEATGDVRLYGVLGLVTRDRVRLTVHCEMAPFFKQFLRDCGVVVDELPRHELMDLWKRVERNGASAWSEGYGFDAPGNLFKLQYDIMSGYARKEVRQLANLDPCVAKVRERLGLQKDPRFKERILIIHTKKKAFYREKVVTPDWKPGVNYHEEHKLSLSLALAVGAIAADADYTVYINDDTGKVSADNSFKNAKLLLATAGYQVSEAAWAKVKPLPREGALLEQYAKIGKLGTTNVTHLGGRSGHLEFMIYLGQNVFYCEEPQAEGENRIFKTLCRLTHQGRYLMQRILLDPTTAGGRHQLEQREEDRGGARRRLNPGPSNSRVSMNLEATTDTTDYYKVTALGTIVRAMGLEAYGTWGGRQLEKLPRFDDEADNRWLFRMSGERLVGEPPARPPRARRPAPERRSRHGRHESSSPDSRNKKRKRGDRR